MNKSADELIIQLIAEDDYFKKAQLVDLLRRDECIPSKEIAQRIKKHPSYISHLTRLLRLPPLVIDGYYANQISLSHLVILSRLEKKEDMERTYEVILSKGLTSSQTEELIRLKKFDIESNSEKVSPEEFNKLIKEFETKFKDAHIKIIQTRIKGKIVIELKGDSKRTSDFLRKILSSVIHHEIKDASGEEIVDELMILE